MLAPNPPIESDAFGKGTNDEIDFVFKPRLIGQTAAVLSQNAKRVRLVEQQGVTVFAFHIDEFLERCPIPEHGVDTFEHHQSAGFTGIVGARQPLGEIVRVIVPEPHQLCAGDRTGVIDTGVRIRIEIDRVLRPPPGPRSCPDWPDIRW